MTKQKKIIKSRPPKNYNKYHLVIRNKKGKQIVANFGLRKYTEGKTVGKSFYMQFNPDKLYYTPTFLQQNMGNKFTPESYYKEHEKKVKKSRFKTEGQIKVPKPRGSASNYCAVCKIHYTEEYFAHIGGEDHINKRNNDKYQKMILKLQKFYLRRKQRRWQKIQQKKQKKCSEKHKQTIQKKQKDQQRKI